MEETRLAALVAKGNDHLKHDLAAVRLWMQTHDGMEPETYEEYQEARRLVNVVMDTAKDGAALHAGTDWPISINWADYAGKPGTHLGIVGELGVDSASVTIQMVAKIGDIDCDYRTSVFTPEGDGSYAILAGHVEGLGRCLVISFDRDPDVGRLARLGFPGWLFENTPPGAQT